MYRRHFLSLGLLLSGCGGGGGSSEPAAPQSAAPPVSLLVKQGVFVDQQGWETAVVVFRGEVLTLSFERDLNTFDAVGLTVRRWATGEILAQHPWSISMGCAIVKDGVIHVYGATDWRNGGNRIIHCTLDQVTFAPSAAVDALTVNPTNGRFYNTGVTADANGYRMAVEISGQVFFARSADLNAWTFSGGQMMAGSYIGCPSIHYVDGAHCFTWLAHDGNGNYSTRIAKSVDDCFTFTYGQTLLSPGAGEGINNSDVDMIEHEGKVYGVYIDGDQATYGRLHKFTYDGTMAKLFADFA